MTRDPWTERRRRNAERRAARTAAQQTQMVARLPSQHRDRPEAKPKPEPEPMVTVAVLDAPVLFWVDEDGVSIPRRGRADRCPPCDARAHGHCEGGDCTCPSIVCDGKPWRR